MKKTRQLFVCDIYKVAYQYKEDAEECERHGMENLRFKVGDIVWLDWEAVLVRKGRNITWPQKGFSQVQIVRVGKPCEMGPSRKDCFHPLIFTTLDIEDYEIGPLWRRSHRYSFDVREAKFCHNPLPRGEWFIPCEGELHDNYFQSDFLKEPPKGWKEALEKKPSWLKRIFWKIFGRK